MSTLDPTALQSQIENLKAAVAADPTSPAFLQLAQIYMKLGKLDDAIATCRDGLAKNPHAKNGQALLAQALIQANQSGEAEKILIGVIRATPNDIVAHQVLARMYATVGKEQHAKAIAQRLQTLNPNDPLASQIVQGTFKPPQPQNTVTMARLYEQQGHFDKALQIYTELAKNQPEVKREVERLKQRQDLHIKVDKLNTLLESVKQQGDS